MDYYTLNLFGLSRKLPLVSLGPKLKIASFNLLGDGELVNAAAEALAEKLKGLEFDILVGPEVKVVPLLQVLSQILEKPRYIVLRKKIHGYMVKPIILERHPTLVLDGRDAEFIKGKKAAIVDDVVSTGRTLKVVEKIIEESGGEVIVNVIVLKQGEEPLQEFKNLIVLGKLPLFNEASKVQP